MGKNVAIYGAGKGGMSLKELFDLISGYEVVCFIDDDPSKESFGGLAVVRSEELEGLKAQGISATACEIADSKFRLDLRDRLQKIEIEYLTVIHPTAFVSPSATIGKGCFIKAGAVVETNTIINDCCIIDNGVVIPHHNHIEEGCHLAPGVSLGSGIVIGQSCIVGIGASIATGVRIGGNVIIGVGTSVVNDVPDNAIVQGVPGKVVGHRR